MLNWLNKNPIAVEQILALKCMAVKTDSIKKKESLVEATYQIAQISSAGAISV